MPKKEIRMELMGKKRLRVEEALAPHPKLKRVNNAIKRSVLVVL